LTRTGCDIIAGEGLGRLGGMRVGLLENPSSFSSGFVRTRSVLAGAGAVLSRLFGPQHGIYGETQANMIEWEGFNDPELGIPVHSLYGTTRSPLPEWLEGLDAVVMDLQDVGARPYTYIWTSLLMMEECARQGVEMIVLDRPNPAGGALVEGPVLQMGFESFVGMHPVPLRHGLTIGEMMLMLNGERQVGCRLSVVEMDGWERDMLFGDTGLPWFQPSPNIPSPAAALVYSGMVLLEGTNISEGRGTTRPFETAGAPWIDPAALCGSLRGMEIPGAAFTPVSFVPTFDKYAGELCGGVRIYVTDARAFRPVRCAALLIGAAGRLCPGKFEWARPPYEYEESLMPIDIIYGGEGLRRAVDSGADIGSVDAGWADGEKAFEAGRRRYLLYDGMA